MIIETSRIRVNPANSHCTAAVRKAHEELIQNSEWVRERKEEGLENMIMHEMKITRESFLLIKMKHPLQIKYLVDDVIEQ